MKLSCCLTVLTLAAGVLAKGSCNEDEEYCGSYLVKARGILSPVNYLSISANYTGWTYNDLEGSIAHSNLGASAAKDPLNVLFECIGGSRIDAIRYCHNTCHETGPGGGNDYCESEFTQLWYQRIGSA